MEQRVKDFNGFLLEKENELFSNSPHREWEKPEKDWSYYQEWNRVLFMHWEVSYEDLRPLVPAQLELDSFDGKFWVSVVPFTMEKIRPAYLPSFSPISDFHEINVRTYVKSGGKKGVYFINIEAEKFVSAFVSRSLSGLPYEKSNIERGQGFYKSNNKNKGFYLDVEYKVGPRISEKTPLMVWLSERYCLYMNKDEKIYMYEIDHSEWEMKELEIEKLDINYSIGAIKINEMPDIYHYSPGVKVRAWAAKEL
jgi:uncharacterized protein YqjF (DUF2071 family)